METTLIMILAVIAFWAIGIISSEIKTVQSRAFRLLFMSMGFLILYACFNMMGIDATAYTIPTGVTVPYVSAAAMQGQALLYYILGYATITAFTLYIIIEGLLYYFFLMAFNKGVNKQLGN